MTPSQTPLSPLSFWQEFLSFTQDIEDPNNNDDEAAVAASPLVPHDNIHHAHPHPPQQQRNNHVDPDVVQVNGIPDSEVEIVLQSIPSSSSAAATTAAVPTTLNASSAASPTSALPSATATTTGAILPDNNNGGKNHIHSPTARPAVGCTHGLQLRSDKDAYKTSCNMIIPNALYFAPVAPFLTPSASQGNNFNKEEAEGKAGGPVADGFAGCSTANERDAGKPLFPGVGTVTCRTESATQSLSALAAITAATPPQTSSSSLSSRHSSVSRDLCGSRPLDIVMIQTNPTTKEQRLALVWRDDSLKATPASISHSAVAGSVVNGDSFTPMFKMATTTTALQQRVRYIKNRSKSVQSNCPSGGGGGEVGGSEAGTGGAEWTSLPGGECDASSVTSRHCDVCGEPASGHYFGALVCLPCKSFFIRCTKGGDPAFSTDCGGSCDVQKSGRIRCQFCRFQRCLSAGMYRKEKPEAVVPGDGQVLCKVCCDIANGVHFGVTTCEGCKKFFRRGLKEHRTYVCKATRMCTINPRMRNNCRYCRYQKCIQEGMSREAIKMGRPKKGNQVCVQVFKHHSENSSNRKLTYEPDDILTFSEDTEYETSESEKQVGGDGGGDSRAPGSSEHKFILEAVCDTSYLSDDFLDAVSMGLGGVSKSESVVTSAGSLVQAMATTSLSVTNDRSADCLTLSPSGDTSICPDSSMRNCNPQSPESAAYLAPPPLTVQPLCVKMKGWMKEELPSGTQVIVCNSPFPECTECSQLSPGQSQAVLSPPCYCISSEGSCSFDSHVTCCNSPCYNITGCRPHANLLLSVNQRSQNDFVLPSRPAVDLAQPTIKAKYTAASIPNGKPLLTWRSLSQPLGHSQQVQQMSRRHRHSAGDWPDSAIAMEGASDIRPSDLPGPEARGNLYETAIGHGYSQTVSKSNLKTMTFSSKQSLQLETDTFADEFDELLENLSNKPTLPHKAASSANIQSILNSNEENGSLGMKGCSVYPISRKSSTSTRESKFPRQENQRRQSDSALGCFENAKRSRLEPTFYAKEDERNEAHEDDARSNSFSIAHSAGSDLLVRMNSSHGGIGNHSLSTGSTSFLPSDKLSCCLLPGWELPQTQDHSALYSSSSEQPMMANTPTLPPTSTVFRHPTSKIWPWGSPGPGYPQHTAYKPKKKSDTSPTHSAHFGVQPISQSQNNGDESAVAREENIPNIVSALCSLAGAFTQDARNEKCTPNESRTLESETILEKSYIVNNNSEKNYFINNKENYSLLHNRPALNTCALTVDTSAISSLLCTSPSATHTDCHQMNSNFTLSSHVNSDAQTILTLGPRPTKEVDVATRVSCTHFPITTMATTSAFTSAAPTCSPSSSRRDQSLFMNVKRTGACDNRFPSPTSSGSPSVFPCNTVTAAGSSSASLGMDRGVAVSFCSPVQHSVNGTGALTLSKAQSYGPGLQNGCTQPHFANHINSTAPPVAASLSASTNSDILSEYQSQALQQINRYFLSLDNSCEKNHCGDSANGSRNAYDNDNSQRQYGYKTTEQKCLGTCLSRLCQVCSDNDDGSAQDTHVNPVTRAVCTRRHHRYWHRHNTSRRAVPMTASSQHVLSRVAEALRQFRNDLSHLRKGDLKEGAFADQEEQTFASSEKLLMILSYQYDAIVAITKRFLLHVPVFVVVTDPALLISGTDAVEDVADCSRTQRLSPTTCTSVPQVLARLVPEGQHGADTLASEDVDSLSQQLGFDSALLALSSQAFDAECWRFRGPWSWIVAPASPLFTFKTRLLALAGRLHAIGMDNMETALLCGLSLFSTDVCGLKRREAIHAMRVSLLTGLEAYVSSKDQWFIVRVQRLFSVLPEVRVISAWYRSIVSHSRLTPLPADASS